MKCLLIIAMLSCLLVLSGCSSEHNPAMSLEYIDPVYVVINPASLVPMKQDGAQIHCQIHEARFAAGMGRACAVYTDEKLIPHGLAYRPMHPRDCFDMVLAGDEAAGIEINPDSAAQYIYTISNEEIRQVIERYKKMQPLPLEVRIKE